MEETFHTVSTWVRNSSPSDAEMASNDEKLRLYGLYKHVTTGPCPGDALPPVYQLKPRLKYQAWEACQSLTTEEAMGQYVKLLASRNDDLGGRCKDLLADLSGQRNTTSFESGSSSDAEMVEKYKSHRIQDALPIPDLGTNATDTQPTIHSSSSSQIIQLLFSFVSLLLRLLGVRPMIPRGKLDISFLDLLFALDQCLRWRGLRGKCNTMINEIQEIWQKATGCEVAVGFSVRSLFDLYLCTKQYPKNAEVVVFPPITVPGMVHVTKCHGLKLVPVDIGESTWWNEKGIEEAVTKKTVAIMIVHPFGMVSNSQVQMQRLRDLSTKQNVELWEDCAECFTGFGPKCYLGNDSVDVRFFSFGMIKTATALGGGIAIFRAKYVARQMQRLQFTLCQQQSTVEFMKRVVLSLFLNSVALAPYFFGLFASFCSFVGLDYNKIVTHSLRGFPVSNSLIHDKNSKRLQSFIRHHIRKRPSPALLALLLRRFKQSTRTAPSMIKRLSRCKKLDSTLRKQCQEILMPNPPVFANTYWAFPVFYDDRELVSAELQKQGFDVVSWASQLCCVTNFDSNDDSCPRAARLMNKVLYLPISSQNLTVACTNRLAASLQRVLKASKDSTLSQRTQNATSKTAMNLTITVAVALLSLSWTSIGWNTIPLLLSFCAILVFYAVGIFGLMTLFFHFLRRQIANLYLHHESWFKHFDMIDGATSEERLESEFEAGQAECILTELEALELPSIPRSNDEDQKVLLTGATGFVGSLLLRELLFYRKRLSIKGGVIVLCRRKGNVSAKARIASLLAKPMFNFLSEEERDHLVEVVEGDVTQPSIGLSKVDFTRIIQNGAISHVFHAAAAVSFTQELPEAAKSNISSTLAMQTLASQLKRGDVRFIHISTAFVHGNKKGSASFPLKEDLFPLDPFEPESIYRSMLGSQFYATKAMSELGFPNTYAFSKCVCEHLLLERRTTNTLIIRPSIVGPAVHSPFEGWAGGKPSTLVAASMLYLSLPWNIWHLPNHGVAYIPVDILCRFILSQTFSMAQTSVDENSTASTSSSNSSFQEVGHINDLSSDFSEATSLTHSTSARWQRIKTATMRVGSNEGAMFTWLDFGVAQCHLAVITGSVTRPVAQFALFIAAKAMPSTAPSSYMYRQLHSYFIQLPIRMLVILLNWLNCPDGGLGKISPFLELPLLFFPFVKEPFYFETDLAAGDDFDAKRYAFSCGVAAHRFLSSLRPKKARTIEGKSTKHRQLPTQNLSSFSIGGRQHVPKVWDSLWAISQPQGSCLTRLTGVLFRKILRRVSEVVTVDLLSFRQVSVAIRATEQEDVFVILAPTHRSFFDFILLSYLCFSVPELRLDIPFIVAASEFEQLPILGMLAYYLKAVFIQRGRGIPENGLSAKLASLKKNSTMPGRTIEVFLEGKRSRDRRFVEAKTGLLKSLKSSGGSHMIIPITVNYEAIPEQNQLSDEAAGCPRQKLSVSGLFHWLKEVFHEKVAIGKIHIVAGNLIPMTCQQPADFKKLVTEVQIAQQSQVRISDYHISATARFCRVDTSTAREALEALDCTFWPVIDDGRFLSMAPSLPTDDSSICSVVLQCSHLLAPLFLGEQKTWSKWLDCTISAKEKQTQVTESTRPIYDTFTKHFVAADMLVNKAFAEINRRGFQRPSEEYLMQVASILNDKGVPRLFIHAAISMRQQTIVESEYDTAPPPESLQSYELTDSKENLGFWGFRDSGFVLKFDKGGRKYVSMKGKRYSLCGKQLLNLLPFMESEMRVQLKPLKEFASNSIVWQMPNDGRFTDSEKQNLARDFEDISFSTIDRVRHGSGHSQEDVYLIRTGGSFRIPDAVVRPKSEDDIEKLVGMSKRLGYCLIPFGGGTNVSNATRCPSFDVESRPIISVDMKKMRRVLWVNEEDGVANVEAGITGRELADELGRRGWTMGHEPDSFEFSTLGGWIATKASGMKRNRYGNIEDIVKAVRVVGVDGTLWNGSESGKIAHGRVAEGFDLCSLIVGSEGCLGIISSAVIRIWPLPDVTEYDSVVLRNFDDGLQFIRSVERLGAHKPVSVRLLDNAHFRLGQALRPTDSSILGQLRKGIVQLSSAIHNGFDFSQVVCATVSYEGTVPEVKLQKKLMQGVSANHGGMMLGSEIGKDGYDLTFMIAYLRDFAMTYHLMGESFETFVPWSRVETLIRETKNRILKEHQSRLLPGLPFVGSRVTQLYHEGVCVYFYLCFNFEGISNASEVFSELEKAARDEILLNGGSLSHHHGIGKLRAEHLKDVTTPTLSATIGAIKRAVDSQNIFGARNGPFAHA